MLVGEYPNPPKKRKQKNDHRQLGKKLIGYSRFKKVKDQVVFFKIFIFKNNFHLKNRAKRQKKLSENQIAFKGIRNIPNRSN